MNELICSIIHIYYGRIPLQTDFFLPLIKPVFQHQHIKSVNIRLAIFIFNMSASIKNKPNRHRLNYRHIIQLIMLVQFQSCVWWLTDFDSVKANVPARIENC